MVNSADFTKRLEKILDYYGLSATAFSEKIDFNRSTISHLLSGRNKPSLEFVMKVVQTFDEVDVYWLLNGKGSFPTVSSATNLASEEKQKQNTNNNQKAKSSNNLVDPPSANTIPINTSQKQIDRIVIFYRDGSFKEYLP